MPNAVAPNDHVVPQTEDFKVGQTVSFTQVIDDKLVRGYADLTGDHNPIHVDDAFAKKTKFRQRIAHGLELIAANEVELRRQPVALSAQSRLGLVADGLGQTHRAFHGLGHIVQEWVAGLHRPRSPEGKLRPKFFGPCNPIDEIVQNAKSAVARLQLRGLAADSAKR